MRSSDRWINAHVQPTGPAEVIRDRVWARTSRIPTPDGPVWFKACARSHAFEPELVAQLACGWPDLLPRVLAHDEDRGWLLVADAGSSFEQFGNPPELRLRLLPRYAELQREASVPTTVPDRTLERWPILYDDLAGFELPLDRNELGRLRRFMPRFAELCGELAEYGLPATIQHDDLHHKNAFVDGDSLRIVDWGDASRSHPFVSLVVTFRCLEERNGLRPDDPRLAKLRDAYLEPWGTGLVSAFDLSAAARPLRARVRVGLPAPAVAGRNESRLRRPIPGCAPARAHLHLSQRRQRSARLCVAGGNDKAFAQKAW